ncbi:MAG TPA: lysylphosphatidylglycerol synthase transmembrane domain-containing protein [Burkholderiaceae bacterium]|nr:lysylphosphatidylglycerol synthase transmembrane domain-containing protein [Burkholderiaceae bacterium]
MSVHVPHWLRLVAAPVLLAVVVALAGPREILAAVLGADLGWLALGLASATVANVMSALRWRGLCRWLGLPVPTRWAIVTYFRGVAVNAVLPGAVVGGDVMRAYGLQRLGHPGVEAGVSVVLDRLSGLWMLVVLGLMALAWGAGTPLADRLVERWPQTAALPWRTLAWTAVALLVLGPWFALRFAARWLPRRGARPPGWVHAMTHPRAARRYAVQVLLSLAVQALSAATLACAARALGQDIPLWALTAAAVPIFLMATLPVSFGGWGTREATAVLCLGVFGVPAHAAVTMSVIYGIYPLLQAAFALGKHGPGRRT